MHSYRKETRRIVLLGVFTAILAIQNFGPMPGPGYIPIPGLPFVLTIIPGTIVLAALCLDVTGGFIIGGVWGVFSMLRAYYAPTPLEIMIFTNPFVSIFPRVFVGAAGAALYRLLARLKVPKAVSLPVVGAVGAVVNTVLVLTMVFICYHNGEAAIFGVNIGQFMGALSAALLSSGALEAALSAIIVAAVGIPLLRALERRDKI